MIIRARAPLRLGLAGGGTDVSPYCDLYGGYVLNATIDRYAYAVIRTNQGESVTFTSSDQNIQQTFDTTIPFQLDGTLDLQKSVYNYMIGHYNNSKNIGMELITFCDAPPGSGLGSSSTLVVALIHAFSELLNLALDDYTIAQLAYKIERVDCNLEGGRQDQFSASFGGFNFMEFYESNRTVVNPLRIKNWIICELEASLVLFYTGVSRDSAKIIKEQSNNMKSGNSTSLQALDEIKNEAITMKDALLKGDFPAIVKSMKLGWENKKMSAKTVSNPKIDEIYRSAIDSGALAGKISGAGGGGFMLFFVTAEHRMSVIRSLENFNGEVSNCHFTTKGSEAWKVI